ncbi:NADPH:quinone oxidoreductase family protein, partial [Streptomyces sp900116325]
MLAIQFDHFGGPEVLRPVELAPPVPGPGELLITVEAAGVNFADTHQTDGSYLG